MNYLKKNGCDYALARLESSDADITGASVIAPSGFAYMQDMNPPIANGKFTTDENKAFYMFQKGKSPQNLGKDINMDEYIKK